MTPSPFIPGDLVRRTGESVRHIKQGEDYTVELVTDDGWLKLEGEEWEFPARGFSLVQRAEGKS